MIENKIKVIIIEDSIGFLTFLENSLNSLNKYEILNTFDNANEALWSIMKSPVKPDIFIIDIHLNGSLNGIDLGRHFSNFNIPIIFITNYEDASFYKEAQPIPFHSYIIKPFHIFTLDTSISNLLLMYKKRKELGIIYKVGSVQQFIEFSDIIYLEADGNYTTVFLEDRKYVYRKSLVKMKDELHNDDLLQVNKKYIINLKYLKKIDFKKQIVFLNDFQVPLGKAFKQQIENRIAEKSHTLSIQCI